MFKSVRDFDVKGQRILVRCDFNVPIDEAGDILDDFRIKQSLPTIQYLISEGAKVILMSHLDPESTGFVNPVFTLDKVAHRLSELLGVAVIKTDDCLGSDVKEKIATLENGQVLLLENVRFHKGEVDNSDAFAKNLSELGEVYINDAFGVCHRSHASVVLLPKYLPHGMGLLLQSEIENLDKIMKSPKRPLLAIIGGKKVGTKVKFIDAISNVADSVLVSGLIKKELVDENINLLHPEKILAPLGNFDAMDINDETIALFCEKILTAKTIFWNGPFGKFEDEHFKQGTRAIADAIIKSGAFSLVGGGETVAFLDKEGILSKFSHVSPEGGAMLEYLSGEPLPGLKALE